MVRAALAESLARETEVRSLVGVAADSGEVSDRREREDAGRLLGSRATADDGRSLGLAPVSAHQMGTLESKEGRCMMRASDIHARIDWPSVLVQLGIPH